MELGQFPLSLHIKNIMKLKTLNKNLGFKARQNVALSQRTVLSFIKAAQ